MVEGTFKGPSTEFAYIKGKASWIFLKNVSDFSDWRITLHLDAEQVNKVLDLQTQGVKNQLKKDDDGYYVRFRRPTEIKFKDKITGLERTIAMKPPEVVIINDQGEPEIFDGFIGAGSDVEVKLEVYQHGTPGGGKAKAARLLGVRVDHLVPYTKENWTDETTRAVKGLIEDKPKPKW